MANYEFKCKKVINVAAADIFACISDYRQWDNWEPWRLQEPNVKIHYSKQNSGVGAWYQWDGSIIGSGRMETVGETAEKQIEAKIEFTSPMKSSANISWHLETLEQNKTAVTWGMKMRIPMVFGIFLARKVEKNILADFQLGLDRLAAWLDADEPDFAVSIVGEEAIDSFNYLAHPYHGPVTQLAELMPKHYELIADYLGKNNIKPADRVGAVYRKMNRKSGVTDMLSFIEIGAALKTVSDNRLTTGAIAAGRYFKVELKGDYFRLGHAWKIAFDALKMRKKRFDYKRPCLELYPTDPRKAEKPTDIVSWILVPIR